MVNEQQEVTVCWKADNSMLNSTDTAGLAQADTKQGAPLVRCECSTAWCAIENFLQAVKPLQQAKLHGFYAHCLFICCILNTADSHCSPIVAATGCKEATTFKKQFEGTATGWVRNLPVSLADSWHDFDRRSAFSLRLVCLAHSYMKHSQAHESSSFVQSRVFR